MTPVPPEAKDKKAVTPLWIVALFVSLTELVLGAAVTQTTGGIQVALTVFVIVFPTFIAGFFFVTLWNRPYVFYPPTEFGHQTNVADYVAAMQRRPALMQTNLPNESVPSKDESEAAKGIAQSFISHLPINSLLFLYAYTIAHSKQVPLSINSIAPHISDSADYGWAVLTTTSAAGLLSFTTPLDPNENTVNITSMNEKLKSGVKSELIKKLENFDEKKWKGVAREDYVKYIGTKMTNVEAYF